MNKKNTTKKSVKPAYVVDITNCESIDDVRKAFIVAKAKNNIPVSKNDVDFIVSNAYIEGYNNGENSLIMTAIVEALLTPVTFTCEYCEKKKPWYKRFWNWLLGRN